jgi:hypothetical protein
MGLLRDLTVASIEALKAQAELAVAAADLVILRAQRDYLQAENTALVLERRLLRAEYAGYAAGAKGALTTFGNPYRDPRDRALHDAWEKGRERGAADVGAWTALWEST